MQRFALASTAALVAVAAPAWAQGDNTCATAQVIAGNGTYAFDTTLATTDGVGDALCLFFSNNQIHNDVWWSWTSASTGTIRIEDCTLTALDSKIAVYDGAGCVGTVIACNDDSCGLQSRVEFAAVAGNVYTIRLGAYSATGFGTGSIVISDVPPLAIQLTAVNPANGHTYHLLEGASWSAAQARAVQLGGNLVTIGDQAEHDWLTQTFHNFQAVDIDLWTGFNDSVVEGTFAWVSGQPITYTNWDLGEPNNGGGTEDYCAMRKNNPLALWNDLNNAPTGFHANPHGVVEIEATPIVAFCAGDGLSTDHTTPCPCGNNGAAGNGCANSANPNGGNLTTTGSTLSDNVVLQGSGMPATVACIYLQGDGLNDGVFGDGVRCTGGTLLRLRTKINAGGASSFPDSVETITLSARGGVTVGSGARRYYQTYYRNSAGLFCPPETFNVTNGVQIDW
ncbi:MAG: hypothetical protein HZA53_01155 [Planctomycetes bacterium]|nr:hypothetical protein [Planctomycetota bacterium]